MTEEASGTRSRSLLAALIVLACGLAAHLAGLGGAFIYDDLISIVGNPYLAPLWPPGSTYWAVPDAGLVARPVVSFSLALNHALGGLEPRGYHVLNLAWHLGTALLLLALVRRTLRSAPLAARFGEAADGLALASALLWVVHPLTTGAVTYVYQRSEVAMGFFLLATLLAASASWHSRHPRRWQALAIATCLLGMGAKETMVAAPLLVLSHDALFGAGSVRAAWSKRRGLYVGLGATWLALAWLVVQTGAHRTSVGYTLTVSAWDYLKTQASALVLYLKLSLWPQPLVFDYGWPIPEHVSQWALPGACVLALFVGTLIALRRRHPVGFLGLWFFAILGPTSSVIPIVTELVVEHRMYVPLAALSVFVVCGTWSLGRALGLSPRLGVALVIAATALLGWRTDVRGREYADPRHLWEESLRLAPGNARGHYVLAEFEREAGDFAAAREQYLRAIELQPEESFWRLNPGVLAYELGDLEFARTMLTAGVRLRPDWPLAHYNLGLVLTRAGEPVQALASFETALRQQPNYVDARRGLGIACARAGRERAAAGHLEAVLGVRPGDLEALVELAQLLTVARDGGVRDGARALELARLGQQLTGRRDVRFFALVAGAQAELGDFAAALGAIDRALERAGPGQRAELLSRRATFAAGRTLAEQESQPPDSGN